MRLAVSLMLLGLGKGAWAAPAGRTHFLSHGPGAAEQAMGEAVVSMVSGPASLYYNSARLGSGPSAITGEWVRLMSGASYSWVGASADLGVARLGLGLVSLDLGDVTARSRLDDPGSTISSYQRAYLVGSAKEVIPGLWTGTTLGILDYNLAGYGAKSLFTDLGLSYSPSGDLALGLALKNGYFSGLSFGGERERYPRELRAGASWSRRGLLLSSQLEKILDGSRPAFSAGLGYSFFKLLTLRAGMNGYPRFGVGLLTPGGRFAFDLAYQAGAVNANQRITLSYYFKPEPEETGPKDPYAELEERAKSLAGYYSEEAKMQLEAKSYGAFDALKKQLALDPSSSDAALALRSETGMRYRSIRGPWFAAPWGKRRRRQYLRFAVSFAEDARPEACITGREFARRWPRDSRSVLIQQLLSGYGCDSK